MIILHCAMAEEAKQEVYRYALSSDSSAGGLYISDRGDKLGNANMI